MLLLESWIPRQAPVLHDQTLDQQLPHSVQAVGRPGRQPRKSHAGGGLSAGPSGSVQHAAGKDENAESLLCKTGAHWPPRSVQSTA
jgi:hypothetical protein